MTQNLTIQGQQSTNSNSENIPTKTLNLKEKQKEQIKTIIPEIEQKEQITKRGRPSKAEMQQSVPEKLSEKSAAIVSTGNADFDQHLAKLAQ